MLSVSVSLNSTTCATVVNPFRDVERTLIRLIRDGGSHETPDFGASSDELVPMSPMFRRPTPLPNPLYVTCIHSDGTAL